MKKALMVLIFAIGLFGFAYAENDGCCDIREDNKREWDATNMKIQYKLGATIEQIMADFPEYTYDEIYFIVENN